MIGLRLQINPTPLHESWQARLVVRGRSYSFTSLFAITGAHRISQEKSVEESEGKFKPDTCAICLTACDSSWRDELAGRAFQLVCISYLSWSLPLSVL
jgi:hypothetical protein